MSFADVRVDHSALELFTILGELVPQNFIHGKENPPEFVSQAKLVSSKTRTYPYRKGRWKRWAGLAPLPAALRDITCLINRCRGGLTAWLNCSEKNHRRWKKKLEIPAIHGPRIVDAFCGFLTALFQSLQVFVPKVLLQVIILRIAWVGYADGQMAPSPPRSSPHHPTSSLISKTPQLRKTALQKTRYTTPSWGSIVTLATCHVR